MNFKSPLKRELEIEGKLENLAVISQFIVDTIEYYNDSNSKIDSKTIYKTQMAVDEACANIIIHGYLSKPGKIKIKCHISVLKGKFIGESKNKSQIVIDIIDYGKKLDMDSVPTPDISSDLDNREIGGLGIFFIKKFMDKIEYSSNMGENKLKLTKSL